MLYSVFVYKNRKQGFSDNPHILILANAWRMYHACPTKWLCRYGICRKPNICFRAFLLQANGTELPPKPAANSVLLLLVDSPPHNMRVIVAKGPDQLVANLLGTSQERSSALSAAILQAL